VINSAEALRGLLDALDVPVARIPRAFPAQVGLYRSLLAGRRMLIVLDNARDAEQVRPLLPGARGCLTLVTSRNELPGLIATEGAQPLMVELMAPSEARDLLIQRLGAARIAAELPAVDELVTHCAQLPLALAVIAARAALRPTAAISEFVAELSAARGGLAGFASTDTATDLRSVFSWSYTALSPGAARLFRLLGLHWGPHVTPAAAASLAGTGTADAQFWLKELTSAHLLAETTPGCYSFHDLLRTYAAEMVGWKDGQSVRSAAIRRVLDHYLHVIGTASRHAFLATRDPVVLAPPQPGVQLTEVADANAALAWLNGEEPVLLGAVGVAAEAGLAGHSWQLAWLLFQFLEGRGRWDDLQVILRTALSAATSLDDPGPEAEVRQLWAILSNLLENYDDARRHYERALAIFEQLDDQGGAAKMYLGLGYLFDRIGDDKAALASRTKALRIFDAQAHQMGRGRSLNGIAWSLIKLGRYSDALPYALQALDIQQQTGDIRAEAGTWDTIGMAEYHLGNVSRAIECFDRAIKAYASYGDLFNTAEVYTHLGDAHQAADDLPTARVAWREALRIFEELDHADGDAVRGRLESCSP
jgi:tetratricopeptide (TPR) repeat protein